MTIARPTSFLLTIFYYVNLPPYVMPCCCCCLHLQQDETVASCKSIKNARRGATTKVTQVNSRRALCALRRALTIYLHLCAKLYQKVERVTNNLLMQVIIYMFVCLFFLKAKLLVFTCLLQTSTRMTTKCCDPCNNRKMFPRHRLEPTSLLFVVYLHCSSSSSSTCLDHILVVVVDCLY